MSNTIGPQGLTIQTLPQIIAQLTAGFQAIYGTDINTAPNSPDGQMILLFAQAKLDTLQLIAAMNSAWDPDNATGVNLDRVCAYNGVQREAGTYTQQSVFLTVVSTGTTIAGRDTSDFPYTVADGQGNQYQSLSTITFPAPGTYIVFFQAALLGPVQSAIGSITVPVTIIPGIVGAINTSGPTSVGVNEETDPNLRIRRQFSVSLPSRGYWQGLKGALLDVDGVAYAQVYENNGSSTDANGTPSHSIWCVVDVTGSDTTEIYDDVANAIYVKRNAGCGLRGSESIIINQLSGPPFDVLFDNSILQNLWFRAQVAPITGTVDLSYVASQILTAFGTSYGIGDAADASSIVAFIKALVPNCYVTTEGVSINGSSYLAIVNPTDLQHQFNISGSSFISITA